MNEHVAAVMAGNTQRTCFGLLCIVHEFLEQRRPHSTKRQLNNELEQATRNHGALQIQQTTMSTVP